jgi:hypothetical protein
VPHTSDRGQTDEKIEDEPARKSPLPVKSGRFVRSGRPRRRHRARCGSAPSSWAADALSGRSATVLDRHRSLQNASGNLLDIHRPCTAPRCGKCRPSAATRRWACYPATSVMPTTRGRGSYEPRNQHSDRRPAGSRRDISRDLAPWRRRSTTIPARRSRLHSSARARRSELVRRCVSGGAGRSPRWGNRPTARTSQRRLRRTICTVTISCGQADLLRHRAAGELVDGAELDWPNEHGAERAAVLPIALAAGAPVHAEGRGVAALP